MPYVHLSKEERKWIHRWRMDSMSVTQMAVLLGRARSTVYRELRRNASGPASYVGVVADTMYRKRIRWKRHRRVRENKRLMRMVTHRLRKKWSPEQIAMHFKTGHHPSIPERGLSHSTIYRYIEQVKEKGGSLHEQLRRFGNLRPKRYGSGPDGRGYIVDRVLIDERPTIVDKQLRVGDFEGDTMHGPNRKGGIATFVDRNTLYTLALWIPQRSTAALIAAAKKCFQNIPHKFRHTLTVDNGPEFRNHKMLSQAIGMPIYFAHAYASWERPINENTNGLLRQYFPKKQPHNIITPEQIRFAVAELNHRPRKKLGYRSPHEVFWKQCRA
jgi:IS30 family transposase